MKRLLTFLALTCAAMTSFGATLVPIQLLNPTGSASGQAIVSTGASSAPGWANVSATALSGIVPVANGGTGTGALTQYTLLEGNGSSLTALAPGAVGTVVTSNGASAFPTYQSPGQPYFQAYLSSNQTVTANTSTKVQINTKNFDSGGYYDNTTNFRFTPLKAGKYKVTCSLNFLTVAATSTYSASLFRDGTEAYRSQNAATQVAGNGLTVIASETLTFNGTTDYVECFGFTPGTTINGGAVLTQFEAYYIGP